MIGETNFPFFNENYNGYNGNPPSCVANKGITFASYFLLLSTLIPISLIVTLEFVRFAEKNEKFLKVFSCTKYEELE